MKSLQNFKALEVANAEEIKGGTSSTFKLATPKSPKSLKSAKSMKSAKSVKSVKTIKIAKIV